MCNLYLVLVTQIIWMMYFFKLCKYIYIYFNLFSKYQIVIFKLFLKHYLICLVMPLRITQWFLEPQSKHQILDLCWPLCYITVSGDWGVGWYWNTCLGWSLECLGWSLERIKSVQIWVKPKPLVTCRSTTHRETDKSVLLWLHDWKLRASSEQAQPSK